MWRLILAFVVITASSLSAGEHIFISGGPALRYYERHKENDHDKYWGNFIDSIIARQKQISQEYSPDDKITWLIFRPAYVERAVEEKADLISIIEKRVATIQAELIWFDTKAELINYINKGQDRSKVKIERLEYFGHSNKRCFMFDYSSHLDGAGPDYGMLHLDDISDIKSEAFSPQAHCQSWGCHSGEEYSAVWKKYVRVPMAGAIGKTDYSKGGVPYISTPNGKWSQ